MIYLAPHATAFVVDHLPRDRHLSPHTIDSYSDSLLLFAVFAGRQFGVLPSAVVLEQLSIELILDFLDYLEKERGNTARTRNARLTAIKTFFRYLEYKEPACLELSRRVRAIPEKRSEQGLPDWLDRDEIQAIVDAPDIGTASGVRDRAMLHLAYTAALRVSELTSLTMDSLSQPYLDTVHVMGKGRRERILPLWKDTRSALRSWLAIRPAVHSNHLFLSARGQPMSRHGFAHRLNVHAAAAKAVVPSIGSKRLTPHVLRRSCAMHTLEATRWNVQYVSIWLGHTSMMSTDLYVRGNSAEKLKVLNTNVPPAIRKGAFNGAQDKLVRVLSAPRVK